MFLPDPNRDTRVYNNVTHLTRNKDCCGFLMNRFCCKTELQEWKESLLH